MVLLLAAQTAGARVAELQMLGATCLNLPVLGIRWLAPTVTRVGALRSAQSADYLVFASPNAVAGCFRLLPGFRPQGRVYAQGPATRAALAAHGIAARLPSAGFTSEDLLEEPDWRELCGRRVVRIAGVGGRALLLQSLVARGADATAIAVYRRTTRALSPSRLAALTALARPVLVISSAESVQALARRLPPTVWQSLRSTPWLVSSPRLAELAAANGSREVWVARSAAWVDLRACLESLAAGHGAGC